MAHYDIFRHHLVSKYPAYGHALWEPSRGPSYPAVEVGDVGFIRQGRFHRLFNVLLPAEDPSHQNYGVPEYHEQLTLRMREHIIPSMLSPNNLCSARVTSGPTSRVLASGPDSPTEVVFLCRKKQGAVLSLPTEAKCEDTVALGNFGEWMTEHIDSWFPWVRQLGVGISRMEDIILVTGTHRTRSWTNVAFPGGPVDAQVSFGANVATRGDTVAINWKFSHECSRGAVLNCGPNGENLPEDQCIFIRGFRVTRKLMILPRELKAAAGPNPDPKSDDDDTPSEGASATVEGVYTYENEGGSFPVPMIPAAGFVSTSSEATRDARLPRAPLPVSVPDDLQLISIPTVPEYRDPLHTLLEYIAEERPDCDMAIVHDYDLNQIDGLGDGTSLEDLQPDTLLRHLRRQKPIVYLSSHGGGVHMEASPCSSSAATHVVASTSTIFYSPSTTSFSLDRARGFDSAGTTSLRERSSSQPPRTFSQNILSAHSHRAVSLSLSRGNPTWTQRPFFSFSPGTFSSSSSSKSSSFSTTAPSLVPSLGSTFEDDKSEAMSDTHDGRHIHPLQLSRRSDFLDYTRSLSESLATRAGPVGSPYSQPGLGRWNGSSFVYDPPLHRMEESKPYTDNRCSRPVGIPNPSTFDVGCTLLDDGSAFREMWSGTGMHDITEAGGSDTTSRRHSESAVQPRRRVVGFNAPGFREEDESARPIQLSWQTDGGQSLAEDLNYLLSLGTGDPGPVSSSSVLSRQLSSLPIYAPPRGFSPESFSPHHNPYPLNPGGRQTLMKSSESRLSTGRSPSLGPRNFQELAMTSQPEHSPTPFIPAMDHITQPETELTQFPNSLGGASNAHSKLPQAHPQRRPVNELGKGVPLHDLPASYPLYLVEFRTGRTDLFYLTDLTLDIHVGDLVFVEADRGRDLGRVVNDTITQAEVEEFQRQQRSSQVGHSETPMSREQQSTGTSAGDTRPEKEINPKLIYGRAGAQDTQLLVTKMQDEVKALQLCRNKVRQKGLPMEVVDAEYQWDRRKLTFYFSAEKPPDFRELVRELFRLYKTRIVMATLPGPDGMKGDQVSPPSLT